MNTNELKRLEEFQDETGLVAYIVAGAQLAAEGLPNEEFQKALGEFERIVELKSARLWNSPWWRKRIRAGGRSYYEMFVRHWAGAFLLFRKKGIDWLERLKRR